MKLLIIFLLIFTNLSLADYVEIRRDTYLYSGASRQSEPLVKLQLDVATPQQFILLNNHLTNGYFHVFVPGIGHGYVYRTLARRYDGDIPSNNGAINPIDDLGYIRLGAWNIKKLGHGNKKDYKLVSSVIENNFDIIFVIEVMQKGGGHPEYDNLISELGENWIGLITSEPMPTSEAGYAEFYAVYLRKIKITQCDDWNGLILFEDLDKDFFRPPAYGCFVATRRDKQFDFILTGYHAIWGDGDTDVISKEVENLTKVFTTIERSYPGEKDVFLIGDFNLVPDDLEIIGFETKVSGQGSTLNSKGNRTNNLYDHMLVRNDAESSERIGNLSVLDPRKLAGSDRGFYKTVSDHLPIIGKFEIRIDDD